MTRKNHTTTIKICGITRESDARLAIELGVSALGFVFYPKSKRAVSISDLKWLKQLPTFVQIVGLFVNPEKNVVTSVSEQLPIELLQFHGNEEPRFCTQFGKRYIKAIPMQGMNKKDAIAYMDQHTQAAAFLLDNYGQSEIGGSGSRFNWQEIPVGYPSPMIIAGGLNADNVSDIIRTINPYGVDVSSAVEESPGIKSSEKMTAFIQSVTSV